MFEKIKSYKDHPYTQYLKDTKSLGLIVFGILALMVTWSGVKAVQTNYSLQKQISRLGQENDIKQLENTNLKLKNEYLNTDQYLELTARRAFGKAAPDEKVLIVPKEVALAHTVEVQEPKSKQTQAKAPGTKPTYQKNFEAWIDFFMHRQNTE